MPDVMRWCSVAAVATALSCAPRATLPLTPTAFADAGTSVVRPIARGVTHTMVNDPRGPWAFHVVEVDTDVCRPVLEARKPGSTVQGRATTSQLAYDALVTINADFFALPGGTPVGAHVSRAVPLIGPTDRQLFALTTDGWRIGVAQMDGTIVASGRGAAGTAADASARTAAARFDTAALAQVNRMAAAFSAYAGTRNGVTLFTAWMGDTVPADSSARRITLQLLDSVDVEASGRAIVLAVDSPAAVTRLDRGRALLHVHGNAHDWARRRAPGDTVAWTAAVTLDGHRVTEGVGGFPELLRDRVPVLARQTVNASFGEQRHPRTALGWTADRRLLLVVVDGRQPPYSAGMSLPELTWLFQRLGATHALNLDGGGSTAMVVARQLVNRPSDAQGERAVGNALALVQCR